MKMLRLLVALSLVAYSATSFVAHAQIATVDITSANVASMSLWSNIHGDNHIRIQTTPIVNNWGCIDPDSYVVLPTIAKEAQARIYATLLAAKALSKPITFMVEGCTLG